MTASVSCSSLSLMLRWTIIRSPRPRVVFAQQRNTSNLSRDELKDLISKPTWSVRSLLPSKNQASSGTVQSTPEVTPTQLRHLLRLSALPAPRDEAEEARMLETLSSQLHFVRAIQSVDTSGVEPLRSLRDETEQTEREMTFGMAEMEDALAKEEVVGTYHKRIRRRQGGIQDEDIKKAEDWNVLGSAERKVRKFFVVEGAPREE